MRSHPGSAATILCLLAILAVRSDSAVADTTIASVPNSTPVSVIGGPSGDRMVWSAFDLAQNGYVLMTRLGGANSVVPVPVRGVPFDANLGLTARGNTVAVYSRCRREPGYRTAIGNAIINQFPDWRSGRGCDIYQFDFNTGRESRMAKPSTRRNSEFLPTIWRKRIAFARVFEHRRGRAGDRAYLFTALTTGPSGSKRIPAGPRATVRFCGNRRGKRVCRVPVELGPTALDLWQRQLAFSWVTVNEEGCDSNSGIWLDTIGHGRRKVQTACSGDIQGRELLSPTIARRRINYGWAEFGDTIRSRIRRYHIESGRFEDLLVNTPNRVLLSTAAYSTTTLYLVSGGYEPGCAASPTVVEPGVGPNRAPCPLVESPG